jgi:ferrous iron transport protein B
MAPSHGGTERVVAKETVVSSFGIFYGFSEVATGGQEMWMSLRAAFSPLSATSFLIFVLLSAPCIAAISSIRREMNSAMWTLFAVVYMTAFGYIAALMVYQLGTWLQGGEFTLWTGITLAVTGVVLWLIFRPSPQADGRLKRAKAGARG